MIKRICEECRGITLCLCSRQTANYTDYKTYKWWQHPELIFKPTYVKEEDGVIIHYKIGNNKVVYITKIIYD